VTPDPIRHQHAGFKLRLAPECADWFKEDLLPGLDGVGDRRSVTRVKSNNVRTVYRVPAPGGAIYLKRYHVRGPREWIKYLFVPSRATAEWRAARAMREAGLPTVEALMTGEKRRLGILLDGCFATREIPGGEDFVPYLFRCFLRERGEASDRLRLLDELSRLVRRFHDLGFLHDDLHSGNLLVTGPPADCAIHLLDLHTVVRRRKVGMRGRLKNLAKLLHSLMRATDDGERLRFLETYAGGERVIGLPELALETIHDRMKALEWRRLRSRTKRCLRRSSAFDRARIGEYLIYHRRNFAAWCAVLAVGDHLHSVRRGEREILKDSRRSALSRQLLAGTRVVVKETRCRGFLDLLKNAFRRPRGLAAWVNGNGLVVREVGAAIPLAVVVQGRWPFRRSSWLLMEDIHPDERLDLYVLRRFAGELDESLRAEKRRLVRSFAAFLGDLHRRGIYHGDLKAVNVFVRAQPGGRFAFRLVDYDHVRFGRSVSTRRRIKNLGQLAASIAVLVTRTDRLRFFRAYAPDEETLRNEKTYARGVAKALARKIVVRMEPIE
jgi:tRNA A-37 threonylcarbamoyl transferase component Bud32